MKFVLFIWKASDFYTGNYLYAKFLTNSKPLFDTIDTIMIGNCNCRKTSFFCFFHKLRGR